MAEEKFVRRAIYEMDFISNFVVETGINVTNKLTGKVGAPSYKLKPDLVERFKTEVLGELWHTESDYKTELLPILCVQGIHRR